MCSCRYKSLAAARNVYSAQTKTRSIVKNYKAALNLYTLSDGKECFKVLI